MPSHVSGEQVWVSRHGYQPPPRSIRSPPSMLSGTGSIQLAQYLHIWPCLLITTEQHTDSIAHLSPRDTTHTLFGLGWDFPCGFVKRFGSGPQHTQAMWTHSHTHSQEHTHKYRLLWKVYEGFNKKRRNTEVIFLSKSSNMTMEKHTLLKSHPIGYQKIQALIVKNVPCQRVN